MAQTGLCTKLVVKSICPLFLFSHEQGDPTRLEYSCVCVSFCECAQGFSWVCTRVLQSKKGECSRELEFLKVKKGEKTTLFYKKKILNNVFMTSLTKV
jgi:hypothetical protein